MRMRESKRNEVAYLLSSCRLATRLVVDLVLEGPLERPFVLRPSENVDAVGLDHEISLPRKMISRVVVRVSKAAEDGRAVKSLRKEASGSSLLQRASLSTHSMVEGPRLPLLHGELKHSSLGRGDVGLAGDLARGRAAAVHGYARADGR